MHGQHFYVSGYAHTGWANRDVGLVEGRATMRVSVPIIVSPARSSACTSICCGVQTLEAKGDPRAGEELEQAGNNREAAAQLSFLENIPWHREIHERWQRRRSRLSSGTRNHRGGVAVVTKKTIKTTVAAATPNDTSGRRVPAGASSIC